MHAVAKVGDTVIAETDTYEVVEGVRNSPNSVRIFSEVITTEYLLPSGFY
jgi:hypothetical protein